MIHHSNFQSDPADDQIGCQRVWAFPGWKSRPGAGHDARYLHYICPTGMIFIPCKNGISHNETESMLETDAADGTRLLAEAVFALANAD